MSTISYVSPKDAILWLEFGGQYTNSAGNKVVDNMAERGDALNTVTLGDGTTANTIPSQVIGRRGVVLTGTQYINTNIIDLFERTDKFSVFVIHSSITGTNGCVFATSDNAQNGKGILCYQYTPNSTRYIYIGNDLTTNTIETAKVVAQGTLYSYCLTYSGNSLRSGITEYINGNSVISTTILDSLTQTIKNGKSLLLGARWNGTSIYQPIAFNLYFFALFPWLELNPLQVKNLDISTRRRINLP